MTSKKQYKKVTANDLHNQILETMVKDVEQAIETGRPTAWEKPWKGINNAPKNAITKKPYKGINTFILGMQPYDNPHYLTFKQAKDLGGSVRAGEKSCATIYFYKMFKKTSKTNVKDDSTNEDTFFMMRRHPVFNVSQCDIPKDKLEKLQPVKNEVLNDEDNWLEADQSLLDFMDRDDIKLAHHDKDIACYIPSLDTIKMPLRTSFKNDHEYVSTLAHECVHATGHEKRLKRQSSDKVRRFGSKDYSREELVAEMGAGLFSAIHNIDIPIVQTNRIEYLRGWLKSFKNDPKMLYWAGSRASKAINYILDIKDIQED
tara:strand:- start:483 stop:1430 length:948 start_codon:yes stop_codon:yes gene_type:complete